MLNLDSVVGQAVSASLADPHGIQKQIYGTVAEGMSEGTKSKKLDNFDRKRQILKELNAELEAATDTDVKANIQAQIDDLRSI